MKIQLSDGLYVIKFSHSAPGEYDRRKSFASLHKILEDGRTGPMEFSVMTSTDSRDNFSKAVGRKLVLAKLFKFMGEFKKFALTKEYRKTLWEEYLNDGKKRK